MIRFHQVYGWTRSNELADDIAYLSESYRSPDLFRLRMIALLYNHNKDELIKMLYLAPMECLDFAVHDGEAVMQFGLSLACNTEVADTDFGLFQFVFDHVLPFFSPMIDGGSKSFLEDCLQRYEEPLSSDLFVCTEYT